MKIVSRAAVVFLAALLVIHTAGVSVLAQPLSEAESQNSKKTGARDGMISVTFTLQGDDAHGAEGVHTGYTDWLPEETWLLEEGATAYDLFQKVMEKHHLSYVDEGGSYGPYITSITSPEGVELSAYTNGERSGWMFLINGVFTDSMNVVSLQDGDDMVFFYADDYNHIDWTSPDLDVLETRQFIDAIGTVSLSSKGAIEAARKAYDSLSEDQKAQVNNIQTLLQAEQTYEELLAAKEEGDMAEAQKVDELIEKIGEVTIFSRDAIDEARTAYNALTEEQKLFVENYAVLQKAEEVYSRISGERAEKLLNIYEATGTYLLSQDPAQIADGESGWALLGLARAGLADESLKADYYENVVKELKEAGGAKLHRSRSTENSRTAIILTALGLDPTDVEGENLLSPLADMEYVTRQGINGPIWALLAFDTAGYEIPEASYGQTQVTREGLISFLLSSALEDGGWSDRENSQADVDTTAMAIQALAPYYEREEVKKAVEKGLEALSRLQSETGGFYSLGELSCEGCAQVVVALTSLGIDPDKDSRFLKDGNSVMDALSSFASEGGGFCHTLGGSRNGIATEQGYYAMVSYYRLLSGKTSLYNMSDVKKTENPQTAGETESTVSPETGEANSVFFYGGLGIAAAVLFLGARKQRAF